MQSNRLLAAALFMIFFGAFSQAQDKKVEFGIMAGYGHTMPRVKTDNNTPATSTAEAKSIGEANLNGFHVGPILKFNFSEQIGFQTGLVYNYFSGVGLIGSQAAKEEFGVWNQERTNLTCFDVPLRVVYSLALAEDLTVMIYGGPNLNYSISKSTKIEHYENNKYKNDIMVGDNIYKSSNYNALDLQLGAGLGIQWMGVSIRAGYDWGILNRTSLEGVKFRANDIKLSLAYTF